VVGLIGVCRVACAAGDRSGDNGYDQDHDCTGAAVVVCYGMYVRYASGDTQIG
jgi:hypothetical protein